MSAGAVFKLIANDGKADKLITASELLKSRLIDIACDRRQKRLDPTPLLSDIEKTHILYVHSHFKPHAAIGFEYNKVRVSSGQATFGGSMQFSIPQFGDFFSDMVVHVQLSAAQAKAGTVTLPATIADHKTRVKNSIVDAFGKQLHPDTIVATTVTYRNLVRYCKHPGNRIFDKVKFEVNSNPLDEYDYLVPTMHEKFGVPPNKRTGYDRLCGQEVPRVGYGPLNQASVVDYDFANTQSLGITNFDTKQSSQTIGVFANSTVTSTNTTTPTKPSIIGNSKVGILSDESSTATSVVNGVSVPEQYDVCRQHVKYVNGPQTPKPVQSPLDLWIPLHFWFNKDVRDAIASVSIPFGQRYITVNIAPQSELLFEYPSVYLKTSTTTDNTILGANTGTGPLGADVSAGSKTTHKHVPVHQHNGLEDVSIGMDMYINNIFVNPEIHDVFIQRISFSLVRVYRQQNRRLTSAEEVQLNQIKWPVEYMTLGLRPLWNITGTSGSTQVTAATDAADEGTAHSVTGTIKGNREKWQDWNKFTYNVSCFTDQSSTVSALGFGGTTDAPAPDFDVTSDGSAPTKTAYSVPVSTIDSLSLSAHGVTIFDTMSDMMFNQYIPYTYGGCAVNTPDDTGVMMINFSLFPGQKQPAGHLNVSRARETFVKFQSSYLSSKTPGDLCIVAYCINFLLISDGSAVLRFST